MKTAAVFVGTAIEVYCPPQAKLAPPCRRAVDWVLVPIPGEDHCWLQNKTRTAKYDVHIQGRKLRGPARVPVMEANRRVRLDIVRIGHPDDRVTVTWHREQDLGDQQHEWHDDLPPRV